MLGDQWLLPARPCELNGHVRFGSEADARRCPLLAGSRRSRVSAFDPKRTLLGNHSRRRNNLRLACRHNRKVRDSVQQNNGLENQACFMLYTL